MRPGSMAGFHGLGEREGASPMGMAALAPPWPLESPGRSLCFWAPSSPPVSGSRPLSRALPAPGS